MFAEINRSVSSERATGAELAEAARALLAGATGDPLDAAHAVQLATANALLAVYWELRHQQPETSSGANVVPINSRARGRLRKGQWASEPGA